MAAARIRLWDGALSQTMKVRSMPKEVGNSAGAFARGVSWPLLDALAASLGPALPTYGQA